MKVFIAGATGAIGCPLVTRLLIDGHEVFGMTRSEERAKKMTQLGATPIIGDALNEASVLHALKLTKPEVVIEMLTSLPKVYTPQAMKEASTLNTKLQLEGGSYLQKAAEAVGSSRYIIQSGAFWYAPGIGFANEETPFAFNTTPGISAGAKIYQTIENRVLTSKHIEGVALRFGFFYGPSTWYATDGNMADQVRSKIFPIVGNGSGVWSFVHVEDAAISIAQALYCPTGAYNITNNTPLPLSTWLPAYARWLNAPPPPIRTIEDELRINGPDSVYYATKLRGASNTKAKHILNFKPRSLEWLT